MPKYRVPVMINTVVEVDAPNGGEAEDIVKEKAVSLFPDKSTRVNIDTPTVKSAYEVTVTFYMDAFSTEEVEDRVCNLVRKGSGDELVTGNTLGFDVEAIKQGGPCRG